MKRHALFVGVDRYADPTIQNLAFPTEDATELAGAFRLLLKFDRVEKLLNPPHRGDVLDKVKNLTRGLGAGDLFLFFFAGHGFRVKENHVLVCARDEYADLEDEYEGLAVGQLKRRMRGPWNRMIVLDACQNDIRADRSADNGVTARDLGLIHVNDEGPSLGEGLQIVVTACSEGQKALEVADLGHGLFTSALLDSVTSFADDRRRIDLEVLRTDLGGRMGGLISKYRLSGRQDPMFTMPTDAGGIVLLDGEVSIATTPALVVCPVCGRKNDPRDTFLCRECGRDNLCLRHQDEATFLCADCVAKAREKKAREAAVQRKAAEDAKIAKAKTEAERKAAAERNRPAGTRKVIRVGKVEVAFRWCPPGTFMMGSPLNEEGRRDNETQHNVTLTKGFWMGETQVTQALWKAVMIGENPSVYKSGDTYPVENVSWDDCQKFLKALNIRFPMDGHHFALPTEAQWEYACRAGTTSAYGGNGRLDDMGWYDGNSGDKTLPVARKLPNAWGLHDMHGNVREWCADLYGDYTSGAVTDPAGPVSGGLRVLRGGSFWNFAQFCRSATRNRFRPDYRDWSLGLRLLALQDDP